MNARTLIILAVAAALATLARGQDALVLKRTARVEPGRPLVLGDIATLTGPSADSLAGLVLIQAPEDEQADQRGWFRVDLDRVRERLTEHLGEGAGMIALSGSACDVQAVLPPPATPADDHPEAIEPTTPDATELVTLATVRGAVARELTRILQTSPTEIRLTFEPGDTEFLDQPTAGYVLDISPVGASPRLPVAVTRYDAAGRATRRTVRVTVELHRAVAVVSRVIPRGHLIEADDIATDFRWASPTDQLVSPADALGAVARRKLDPGELLETHLVEPPVLVHRGDLIDVRVFCHGMVVARQAHALSDGREGEVIDLAAKDNPRQRIRATIVGPGQATVIPPPTLGSGTAVASGNAAG